MIKVQSTHRRRLEVTRLPDGTYEMKIMLTGPETRIATLIFEAKEFDKLREIWTSVS